MNRSSLQARAEAEPWSERIYYVLLALYLTGLMLPTTAFSYRMPPHFFHGVRAAFLVLMLWRLVKRGKYHRRLCLLLLILLVLLGYFVAVRRGEVVYLDLAMILIGSLDLSMRRISFLYILSAGSMMVLALICSQAGLIADYVYEREGGFRHSLGIVYPTDFYAHLFFLFLAWAIWRWQKISYAEMLAMAAMAALAYHFTEARAGLACTALFLVLIFLARLFHYRPLIRREKVLFLLLSVLFTIMAAGMILLSAFYSPENSTLARLNDLLSDRLSLGHQALTEYPILPFGTDVVENGAGSGAVSKGMLGEKYFFMDSSYLRCFMKNGYVLYALLLIFGILLIRRLIREDKRYGLIFFFTAALVCMIEHHMLELAYNVTLFLAVARLDLPEEVTAGQTGSQPVPAKAPGTGTGRRKAVQALYAALVIVFAVLCIRWPGGERSIPYSYAYLKSFKMESAMVVSRSRYTGSCYFDISEDYKSVKLEFVKGRGYKIRCLGDQLLGVDSRGWLCLLPADSDKSEAFWNIARISNTQWFRISSASSGKSLYYELWKQPYVAKLGDFNVDDPRFFIRIQEGASPFVSAGIEE